MEHHTARAERTLAAWERIEAWLETFTEWIEGVADELHGAPVHAGILRAGTVGGCLSWRDVRDTLTMPSGWVPVGPA